MEFSRKQCHNIKGIAILLITIHNFVYRMLSIHCNEMVFSQQYCDTFLNNVFTKNAFWYIISYAGWIGVPLFFFLSSYGLSKKYNTNNDWFNYWTYIKNHITKLWKLLIPMFLLYVAFSLFFKYPHNLESFISQITFTINILSYGNNDFRLDPGVYWFFGAILQFYILFLVVRKLSNRWLFVLCIVFFAIHYAAIYFGDEYTMKWIRHNFLGWGVPFVLGMLAARINISIPKHIHYIICVCSFLLLCASLTIKAIAPFVEISTIMLFVSISILFTTNWLVYLGLISSSIFVVHPFVRMLYFNTFCASNYPLAMTLIYLITVITLSIIHHYILNNTNKHHNNNNK